MFSAMGTEARLRIMQLLLSAHPEGLVVTEIQEELDIPNSTLSHHLDKLKNEDLVRVQRESTFLRYTANTDCPSGNSDVPVFGVLHPQQSRESQRRGRVLQIGEFMENPEIKDVVKEKYGQAALRVTTGSSCCGAAPATESALRSDHLQPVRSIASSTDSRSKRYKLRWAAEIPPRWRSSIPERSCSTSGSGGGIDVLLSARRVGPTGKAYGLDMTDEMLALANENKRKAGAENVEFLRGRNREHSAA